jgi:hypothetical protein
MNKEILRFGSEWRTEQLQQIRFGDDKQERQEQRPMGWDE